MSASPRAQLLTNASATGNWIEYRGGVSFFVAYGTWNGATATLQYQADNDGAVAISVLNTSGQTASLTANGMHVVALPPGKYKVTFSGSPTSITAYLAAGIKEVR
jgi:hypothetical protein